MKKKNKYMNKKNLYRATNFILGLFLFSFGFSFFLAPNNLVFGGVAGLSIIFKELCGFDTSLFVLVVSVFLLLISFIFLGKEKTTGSILGSLLLPVFLKFAEVLTNYIVFEDVELILSAIFGAFLGGAGLGFVYKSGFTTGGTDIIKQLLNKYFKISMGKAMLISDGVILASSIFVFGLKTFIYALLVLYVMTIIADRVILGVGNAKAFYIVTDKTMEVKKYIINKLGHGVTLLEAVGGYTKEDQKVLFCVIPTREYYILKEGIHKIDNDAFFVVTDAYEVSGGEYQDSNLQY